MKYIIYIFILLSALFFSFIISGAETSLFSLKKEEIERYPIDKDKKDFLYIPFIFPSLLIAIIVTLNTIFNSLSSSIFASISYIFKVNENLLKVFDTLVMGTIIFIFCETLPKNIAFKSPFYFFNKFYIFINIFIKTPFIFLKKFYSDRKELKIHKEEISRSLTHEVELILFTGELKDVFSWAEKNLFFNILEIYNLKAKDIAKREKLKKENLKEAILIEEEDNVFEIFKKLCEKEKDIALIKDKNKIIRKKDIVFYLLKNVQ